MNKTMLFVLISSLLSTGALAGPPGENTHGSTTISVSESILGADTCTNPATATANDSDSDVSASALAYAMSEASSYIDISYSGGVTLDLTRHGNNGAVHQVELNASMGSGTLFAQVASSDAEGSSDAQSYVSAEAQAAAAMIAQAYMSVFQGIDEDIDLVVTEITVKIGTEAIASAVAGVEGSTESSVSAASGSNADSDSSSSASATGGGISSSGSSFYVQGANIEEFTTQLSATSGTVFNVQTSALAQVYADAMATSFAYAMAEASAEAQAAGQLTFEWELPILGSGSLPIVTAFDSATDAAQQIANAAQSIASYAQAAATSSASALGGSSVNMSMMIHYENLPGTEDLLEVVGNGSLALDCSQASSSATASAEADTN
ncbi:hypothetical protein OFO16_22635 [Vibrio natriegens]|uniref:hypothetical protein n=1 Tax=Vibrio natriegens TaxID=691 RepID=UPI0021E7FD79|nr:hypothetical protein [Vibrio natriegens]UYI49169.1 hypothetical protein OFO16_22635 [Vibrio natriegens]